MDDRIISFSIDKDEVKGIAHVVRHCLDLARRHLDRPPRFIRFSYSGDDGKERRHEFYFN